MNEDRFLEWLRQQKWGDNSFFRWAIRMGYLEPKDILEDGLEMHEDLGKIKAVAPKFYNLLMSICDCD